MPETVQGETMQTLEMLEYVIENLIDEPDQLRLTEIEGTEENVIEVRVAPEDIGKIIGKNGSVARALRTLLTAAASKEDKNYVLEIID